ncbi:MAG: hypothetical protein U0401_25275 [Anaerolineae bacterium]
MIHRPASYQHTCLDDGVPAAFELLQQEQWQPTLALDEEGLPAAFAPYPLQHMSPTRFTPPSRRR